MMINIKLRRMFCLLGTNMKMMMVSVLYLEI